MFSLAQEVGLMGPKGSQRLACPSIDGAALEEGLTLHVRKTGSATAFCLFEYETIAGSGAAAKGRSLAKLHKLLLVLLSVSSQGLFKFLALAAALATVFAAFPDCVPQSLSPKSYSRHLAEKLIVALNHVRRICGNTLRWRQCVKNLTAAEVELLKNLKQKIVLTGRLESEGAEDSQDPLAGESQEPPAPAVSTPRRSLKRKTTNEISVDGEGFPKLLHQPAGGSPSPTIQWEPELLEEAFLTSPVPPTKHKIKQAREAQEEALEGEQEGPEEEPGEEDQEGEEPGESEEPEEPEEPQVLKKPAAKKKAAEAQKPQALKKPAAQKKAEAPASAAVPGQKNRFYIFRGTEKSYVQMFVDGKKKSWETQAKLSCLRS